VLFSSLIDQPSFVRVSVCDDILKLCERDILQTTYGNFTEFTT